MRARDESSQFHTVSTQLIEEASKILVPEIKDALGKWRRLPGRKHWDMTIMAPNDYPSVAWAVGLQIALKKEILETEDTPIIIFPANIGSKDMQKKIAAFAKPRSCRRPVLFADASLGTTITTAGIEIEGRTAHRVYRDFRKILSRYWIDVIGLAHPHDVQLSQKRLDALLGNNERNPFKLFKLPDPF